MTMERIAQASWHGGLRSGFGHLSTQSGVLNKTPYSYRSRFEEAEGTDPEELIGAAHAGCFTMALAEALEKAGYVAEELHTAARVVLEKVNDVPTISTVHLDLKGRVPGIDLAEFEQLANKIREHCIVSRVLNAATDLHVALELQPA
jgi:lipoyl-dependent peroxiredoxin